MKKLKWGVLSTAHIASKAVIPGILGAENSELYAVSSRSQKKAADFAAEFGAEKAYDDYEKLLADPEIEAVYIPLPNSLHKKWVLKAAASGKNILCEKPLSGKSRAEAEEMLKAAAENNVKLMEAFMYRFQPFVIELKELIDNQIIGELKELKANFAFDISDRPENIRLNEDLDGGALNDIGCYTVDLARYLFGEMPLKTANFFQKKNENGVDLTGSGILYFAGGRFASLYYSLNSYPQKDIEIIGTKGVIKFPGFFAWQDENYFWLEKEGEVEKRALKTEPQYQLEIEAFAEAVLKDKKVPLQVEDESFQNLKIIEAMRRSADEEAVIRI